PIHGRSGMPINPPRLTPSETGRPATQGENFNPAIRLIDDAKRNTLIPIRTTQNTTPQKTTRFRSTEAISLFNNKSAVAKTSQPQTNDEYIENLPQAIKIAA
ncbi:MAG TPA: hypothetical protein VE973_03690, partial [Candidatus Limnocylindria bacterium]|nr:hypothetical protein [Candidatus Limnocylindria bacterium]